MLRNEKIKKIRKRNEKEWKLALLNEQLIKTLAFDFI